MSILPKWGIRAGNCGDSVHVLYLLIANTYRGCSRYAPKAVENPRTASGDLPFLGSVREETD